MDIKDPYVCLRQTNKDLKRPKGCNDIKNQMAQNEYLKYARG